MPPATITGLAKESLQISYRSSSTSGINNRKSTILLWDSLSDKYETVLELSGEVATMHQYYIVFPVLKIIIIIIIIIIIRHNLYSC